MVDIIRPNQKSIEIQVKIIRPGVTRLTFKDFEDMGNYYQSRLDEFEAKGIRIVTVGIAMFIFEKQVTA